MDWHDYVTGELVSGQLAERRAAATRARLLKAHRGPRASLRLALGGALIRLGSRLVGTDDATRLTTRYRRA
jgi:hypothetical protein